MFLGAITLPQQLLYTLQVNMDPFDSLPVELRLPIFCYLDTRQEMVRICSASPIMLRQIAASRVTILRRVLRNDFPGDLMHDAVAILTFPKPDTERYSYRNRTNKWIREHLKAWGYKRLADPLLGPDSSAILALDSLHRRLSRYINDYLSKATSLNMRRSYLRLPTWTHPSFLDPALDQFLQEPTPRGRVTLSSVSCAERSRLWMAFLRFDLTCRAHCPRPLLKTEVDEQDQLASSLIRDRAKR
ncbi:hypothetical protein F4677DRAFT_363956 [Hypoxylon crocopeplum]|nr:hypothetical protein F4677DRAFT_363956 [Hypoxylon crocopeplum]